MQFAIILCTPNIVIWHHRECHACALWWVDLDVLLNGNKLPRATGVCHSTSHDHIRDHFKVHFKVSYSTSLTIRILHDQVYIKTLIPQSYLCDTYCSSYPQFKACHFMFWDVSVSCESFDNVKLYYTCLYWNIGSATVYHNMKLSFCFTDFHSYFFTL